MARFPQQFIPIAVIAVIGIAAYITAKQMFVPESFGDYGHYRGDAEAEVASLEMSYVGFEECGECHDDIYEQKQESNHKHVSCEVCHGPGANHIEAPDEFIPEAPRGRENCELCHGYDPARPSGFPQIVGDRHNPGKPCMTCHNPHSPVLPHSPEECSACHRKIASQKQLSHHTDLPCLQCHDVPKGHSDTPRYVEAKKPETREACGVCHSRSADVSKRIQRIDIDTHGERYMCWDCHYPHSPEANL